MATFPSFINGEDASKFGIEFEDVGIRSEMDGGYVLTRPRHTRRPRRTFMTGFTDLTNDEFNVFQEFLNTHGTYKAFTYRLKTTKELVNVRLSVVPKFEYNGTGATQRWDITDIKLEEV